MKSRVLCLCWKYSVMVTAELDGLVLCVACSYTVGHVQVALRK